MCNKDKIKILKQTFYYLWDQSDTKKIIKGPNKQFILSIIDNIFRRKYFILASEKTDAHVAVFPLFLCINV